MEQNESLEKIREYARTAVLEEEATEEKPKNKIDFSKMPASKSTSSVDESKGENALSVMANVATNSSISQKSDEQKLNDIKEKVRQNLEKMEQEKVEVSAQNEQLQDEKVEESFDTLFASSLEIKETKDEQIEKELSDNSSQKPKSYKFRFRLIACVFACLVAITGGWVIGNIVEISKTSAEIAQITQTNSEYDVNIAKLIKKISKIDSGSDDVGDPSDGSLLPIEEIITITPQAQSDVTEYQKDSNWFDKICNFFRNLFGG